MDNNTDAGGLGVKMIDGKGVFLPESKRGLPSPKVAFYKIFGLASLFPKSKVFGAYHLTYLDKTQIHEIDILSGAFMLMRKTALDKVGLLDENFFMYGEDIDLSYRIQQGGYKNVYFPETTIIHYKGESTKKSSVNYVFVFYNAMVIFAKKHFSEKHASTFSTIINLAIYFRAGLAIIKRLLSALFLPIVDFTVIVAGLFTAKEIYHQITNIPYEDSLVGLLFPVYGLIWLMVNFLSGGYDKPINLLHNLKGILIGSATVLIFYSLLDESIRFSRALTLIGCSWAIASTLLVRLTLHLLKISSYRLVGSNKKRIGIIGTQTEVNRVKSLLSKFNMDFEACIPIQPSASKEKIDTFQLELSKLPQGQKLFGLNEIIFCNKDISNGEIIRSMEKFSTKNLEYKMAPIAEDYIVGSSSIDTSGDVYKMLENNSINSSENRRKKATFDVCMALFFLIIPIWIGKTNTKNTLQNLVQVLLQRKSLIGYNPTPKNTLLPKIKPGIMAIKDTRPELNMTAQELLQQNINYAQNYTTKRDLNIVFSTLNALGNITL